jgi:hypothetical protein
LPHSLPRLADYETSVLVHSGSFGGDGRCSLLVGQHFHFMVLDAFCLADCDFIFTGVSPVVWQSLSLSLSLPVSLSVSGLLFWRSAE